MTTFDNIIIGSGPAGYHLASVLASRGESVAVVERDAPGGTCLNRGCIPTKCLCASASAILSVAKAAAVGVDIEGVRLDFGRAMAHKESVVANLQRAVENAISGCTIIRGEARLVPGPAVEVGGETYQASHRLVIATGSAPAILPVEGAGLAITSDEALSLTSLPASVAIIGGGVIGMEFASIFSAMGVQVTVIEYCKEILPPFDPDPAKRLRTAMSRRGVRFVTGAAVSRIERSESGLRVVYSAKRGEDSVEASTVLMAVGRRPAVPAGAAEIGISLTPRGFIEVDGMMQTSVPGVYAIGDVNGLSMLAHSAYAQANVVADADPTLFREKAVPSVVFTEPELAMVGPTPAQLDAAGISYRTVRRQYASNGKACASGEAEGIVKILVDDQDTVLGVTILGAHAADLIAEATILVTDRRTLADVPRRYIHAHPTLSELFC